MNSAMTVFRSVRTGELAAAFRACYRRYCVAESHATNKKVVHPYSRLHPWQSENEFTKDLLKNVIYNSDGIIAINKPYGISVVQKKLNENQSYHLTHKIVGAVNYSVQDVLPNLAKELDVPILIPCFGSDKHTSGVYVFGINDKVCQQIETARRRTLGKSRKYWVVTIRVPHEIKGNYRLAMVLKKSVLGHKKPIILTQWTNNAMKRNEVKILNVDHKVLFNSTHNLSSLMEIKASTRMWNSIRLFASIMLYSPILGDNIHGSRVQQIMGTWLKVDPFADSCWDMPKINPQLLNLLNLTSDQQEIIPVHIHLKNVHLIFGKEKKDIIIEAPLPDWFNWTCKQLMFKIPEETSNIVADKEEELAYM